MSTSVGSNALLSNVDHPKKSNSARSQTIGEKPLNDGFEHLIKIAKKKDPRKANESKDSNNKKSLTPNSSDEIKIETELEERLEDPHQTAEDKAEANKEQPIIFVPVPLQDQVVFVDNKPEAAIELVVTADDNLRRDPVRLVYNEVTALVPDLRASKITSPLNDSLQVPLPNHIQNIIVTESVDVQIIDTPVINPDKSSQVQIALTPYTSKEVEFEATTHSDLVSQASDGLTSQLSEDSSDDSLFNIEQAAQNQTISGQLVLKTSEKLVADYTVEELDGASGIKSDRSFEGNKSNITDLRTPSLYFAETDRSVIAKDSATKITNFDVPDISQNIEQSQLDQTTLISLKSDDKELLSDIPDSLDQRALVVQSDNKLLVSFKEIAHNSSENIPHRSEQITMAVRMATQQGKNQISLSMYPENLGSVDISIEFNKTGEVHSIKVFAEKPETLRLLIRDYAILERSLNEVVKADDASLSFNLKDGQNGNNNYQSPSDQHSTTIPAKEDETGVNRYNVTVKPTSTNARNTNSLTGVDIRV